MRGSGVDERRSLRGRVRVLVHEYPDHIMGFRGCKSLKREPKERQCPELIYVNNLFILEGDAVMSHGRPE